MEVCNVCGAEYPQWGTDHKLHPTNWRAVGLRTANVCSVECRDWFQQLRLLERSLKELEDKISEKRTANQENETLKAIREILDDAKKSSDTKLEDIEDLLLGNNYPDKWEYE